MSVLDKIKGLFNKEEVATVPVEVAAPNVNFDFSSGAETMALYAALAPEDKVKLDWFITQLRAEYGALARFLDGVDDLKVHYTAQGIGAIISSLDAGEVVPNASGLAGAGNLTKEQIQQAVADMNSLLTAWWTDVKRQGYDLMAGPPNTGG